MKPTAERPGAGGRVERFRGHRGVTLVADCFGDPAAVPVVLLHGGGQTRHAWGGTAQALAARGHHAIALDLRGHGDSGWCEAGDYAIDAFAADLRAVVGSLNQLPVVVGASLGGLTALVAEGEDGGGVASAVVLVDVAPQIERSGADRIMEFMTAEVEEGFESLEAAAEAVSRYLPQRRKPRDLEGLAKNLRQGRDGRWRWHWDPRFLSAGLGRSVLDRPDRLRAAARALRVPTLLVRGRQSDLLSEEGARDFLDCAPHSGYVDVSEAGHMVAGDRNDAFTRAVLEFLEALS